ncbi:hypothetical protein LTR37_010256 [Vermiconidia calcicola]|uniref:Uncharacterized protein n=1 Tax=Vermiconidia calcicola TaxID=1690605 RepID=A0ACC3N6X9_9PEZI|nr:hypothetical protein LTR37_010256 [Vermiconidia calcicola]
MHMGLWRNDDFWFMKAADLWWARLYQHSNFDAFCDLTDTAGNAQPYPPPPGFDPNYQTYYSDGSSSGRALTGAVTADRLLRKHFPERRQIIEPRFHSEQQGLSDALWRLSAPNLRWPNVLSMHKNANYRPPKMKTPIGKYKAQDCLTDPGTNSRSLQGASTTNPKMTEDMCVKFCLGKQIRYAGIEYGVECYCGNT